MASNVTERDAREVAEAARETEWTLPSFQGLSANGDEPVAAAAAG